ncbi:two-component system sensor histidine kinase NtrB [Desulfonatronovibrio magnus]|uniref:two-component system sensor histidine kinase NtrB n=1 Tax=Desulfonatronovibrio magnus TaxID=698827 RepID=UPI0005EB28C3|nr:ATP-binding protein [Desulfonatronovibrio magnus]
MKIGIQKKYTGSFMFLTLGLLVLAAGLIFLTWQSLRQQQEHVRDQMEVTGRAIIRSVEANLHRGVFRSMAHRRWDTEADPSQLTREVLEELVEEGDVVFLDISGPAGRMFIARDEASPDEFALSDEMTAAASTGLWSSQDVFMGRDVFIMGIPGTRPEILHRGRHMMSSSDDSGAGTVIFIALDMARHNEVYAGFKRGLIIQSVVTLFAVFLIWVLLIAYLKKRGQRQQYDELKTFHSRLLDNMPDGLLSVSGDGIVQAANPAARDLLCVQGELVGSHIDMDLLPEKSQTLSPGWSQVDLKGKALEILSVPISDDDNSLMLVRDRTRIRELEKDLEHARDLATLGRFAAGLAHEIRNPLSSLRGFAQYFQQKFAQNEPAQSYARTMVRESDRLNRVVTDLLYLARPRSLELRDISLEEMMLEIERLLQLDLKEHGCELHLQLDQDKVLADGDLLKQALINLVLNSLDAIDGKSGQITISSELTQNHEFSNKENLQWGQTEFDQDALLHKSEDTKQDSPLNVVSQSAMKGLQGRAGGVVKITVQDNGCGMDENTKARALEPFFSSKGKGTGLGLAIVHRIVRDHKGSITIDSEPGKGTRVSLFLG